MVIFQKPNKELYTAAAGFIASKVPQDIIHRMGETVFTVAIIAWAYLELTKGVNWFRKLLGAAVLIAVSVSLYLHTPGV